MNASLVPAHTYSVHHHPGRGIVLEGTIPVIDFSHFCTQFGKDHPRAVMDAGISNYYGANACLCESNAVSESWRADIEDSLLREYPNSPFARWVRGTDTGNSSRAILFACSDYRWGEKPKGDTPLDAGDLGRCLRLLEKCPDLQARFPEVVKRYPWWQPFVDEWAALQAEYPKSCQPRLDRLNRQADEIRKALIQSVPSVKSVSNIS